MQTKFTISLAAILIGLLFLTACTGTIAGNQAAQAQPEQSTSNPEGGTEVVAGTPAEATKSPAQVYRVTVAPS
jgi:PBP1b-binding outer membrane lipoprotein LpoB